MRYKTLNNDAEITVPTYVQHQQFQRTATPIHLSLLNSKQHVMRTSSAFGPERLKIGTICMWTL